MKTYLVPITDELIKAMEKDEAPSFLHCATCLDGLTNEEVIKLMFPNMCVEEELTYAIVVRFYKNGYCIQFDKSWWNARWGE